MALWLRKTWLLISCPLLNCIPFPTLPSASGAEPRAVPFAEPITQESLVHAIAFNPAGNLLAIGGGEGSLIGKPNEKQTAELVIWDLDNRKKVATLKGHTKPVWCLAFRPDGKTLASGSADATVRLWDVEAGKEAAVLADSPNGLYSLAFSPDGSTLAGAVWLSRREAMAPDLSKAGTVLLWNTATRTVRAKLVVDIGVVNQLLFSPDGKTLATAASKWDKAEKRAVKGELWFWDPATGKRTGTIEAQAGYLSTFAYSPDGKTVVTGGDTWEGHPEGNGRGKVKLWDVGTKRMQAAADIHDSFISGLAFSPDGKFLVATSGPILEEGPFGSAGVLGAALFRGDIAVLDVKTFKKITKLQRQDGAVGQAVFQSRKDVFAVIEGFEVQLREFRSGTK